jgi:hypothetical protein
MNTSTDSAWDKSLEQWFPKISDRQFSIRYLSRPHSSYLLGAEFFRVSQLVKKFYAPYAIQKFITMFTRARHDSLIFPEQMNRVLNLSPHLSKFTRFSGDSVFCSICMVHVVVISLLLGIYLCCLRYFYGSWVTTETQVTNHWYLRKKCSAQKGYKELSLLGVFIIMFLLYTKIKLGYGLWDVTPLMQFVL